MNFLAHIFLSGNNDELMIGNFIADFVKGRKKDFYPPLICKGIELHRMIDHFTDHHHVTSQSRKRLHHRHHKYSGVVVDLFYDHFLARNFEKYSDTSLEEFAVKTYNTIREYSDQLPSEVRGFVPYMIERNWLVNYATITGIGRTLTGLGKRVSFENRMHEAVTDLEQDYELFENEFRIFFPELITFASANRS